MGDPRKHSITIGSTGREWEWCGRVRKQKASAGLVSDFWASAEIHQRNASKTACTIIIAGCFSKNYKRKYQSPAHQLTYCTGSKEKNHTADQVNNQYAQVAARSRLARSSHRVVLSLKLHKRLKSAKCMNMTYDAHSSQGKNRVASSRTVSCPERYVLQKKIINSSLCSSNRVRAKYELRHYSSLCTVFPDIYFSVALNLISFTM